MSGESPEDGSGAPPLSQPASDQNDRQRDPADPLKIMFVAGENSGDMHASRVIAELGDLLPGAKFFGFGGDRMERAGMDLRENLAQKLPIMGFTQVVRKYPKIRTLLREAADMLKNERPDALVLVDYPGFNLRTAKVAHELGIPVIYFISPQFWAWHRSRLKVIRAYVDKMLVILPFEADMLRDEGIAAEYVGHPLQDDAIEILPRINVLEKLGVDPGAEVIGLMPGSRNGEITRHLPVMLEAAEIIKKARPNATFVLPRASTIEMDLLKSYLERHPDLPVTIADDHHKSVRAAMDFVICKSGTSTLEYALQGIPMVIIYKASGPTAFIARRVLSIPHIGLVNIVAQEEVSPELWQERASGEGIARTTLEILGSEEKLETTRVKMAQVREKIGGPGASRRAAEAIAAVVLR